MAAHHQEDRVSSSEILMRCVLVPRRHHRSEEIRAHPSDTMLLSLISLLSRLSDISAPISIRAGVLPKSNSKGGAVVTNIFVGNLSFQTTQAELETAFGQYGTVERVNIVT